MTRNRPRAAVVAAATAIALSAVGVIGSAASTAAPSSFELVFDGRQEPMCSVADFLCDGAVQHVGEFTASAPFCSSGRFTTPTPGWAFDVDLDRLLTCEDGSGSIIARVTPESGSTGGSRSTGTWRVISGTGDYATLRGQGTFASVQTGGDPLSTDDASFAFRSTWSGMADLDDRAPAIDISSATAAKLRRPAGAYTLEVALALRDEIEGNPVSYELRVMSSPSARKRPTFHVELAKRIGTVRTGTVTVTMRVRPYSPGARELRLRLTASDRIGNESSISRVVELPR